MWPREPVLCSVMTWRDGIEAGGEAREGGVCIIMVYLCCSVAETNTTLQKLRKNIFK